MDIHSKNSNTFDTLESNSLRLRTNPGLVHGHLLVDHLTLEAPQDHRNGPPHRFVLPGVQYRVQEGVYVRDEHEEVPDVVGDAQLIAEIHE